MKILITGGAGYVGSHVARVFLKDGHQVSIYDNLSSGYREALPSGCSFLFGDVRDTDQLRFILNKDKVDGVIHCAGKLSVPESLSAPLDYYDHNVSGTIALGKACQATNVSKIIFSSTAFVYQGDNSSLDETSLADPQTPYGQSKLMAEKILQDFEAAGGARTLSLRYFNVAGASEENGQRTPDATHLIKVCAEAACGKRPFVEIFGTNYSTPDGTCVRDYIHVEDLAQLHVHAFQALENGLPGQVLNCGYGQGFSVREVIQTMQKVSGVNFEVRSAPRRPGDLPHLVANTSRARELLRWSPAHPDLSAICHSAYVWEQKLQR